MAEKSTKHYPPSTDINEKLISSVDNGIIILDDELTIHYYNKWLEIHTSIKEHNVLDKSICNIFPSINHKTLKRKVKTALRMQTPTFYTASTSKYLIPIEINRINISDFSHMRQDVSIIPFDEEKKLVVLIITDQTNIINTNNLLQSNILKVQELNGELIKERDTIDKRVLLIKFNSKFTITNVSHAYLNLLKYEMEDMINRDLFRHKSFHVTYSLKNQILSHINEKKVFEFENITFNELGEEFILAYTLVPEYDSFAKHIGFILFMEDITSSKKVISQQEKLLVTSRSAAMGDMISMIAHQWRQPLSVINTIMATMRIKKELNVLDDETTNLAFKKIEDTIQYLSETIDDFRNYFKPNKVISEISLLDTINKSTTFLLSEIKLLDIKYELNIDDNLTIQTYQNELLQCIINILKNSIDAFKESKVKGQKLSLNIKKEDTYITLCFDDNAGGIQENILKRIYEPYFSTKAKNGTGLGLYMTKTIIEEHLKGKITITSKDSNTTVLIELPYNVKQTIN